MSSLVKARTRLYPLTSRLSIVNPAAAGTGVPRMRSWLVGALAAAGCQAAAYGQTQRPAIHYAFPAGLRSGQATEITLFGFADPAGALPVRGGGGAQRSQRLFDDLTGAYRALVAGSGVTAEIAGATPPTPDGKTPSTVRLKVTVPPGTPAGLREAHLATPSGVSNAFWIAIGDSPEINEEEPNDRPENAQRLPFGSGENGVVNGRLDRDGDRDLFRITARAGEEIAFSVAASRLRERSYDGDARCDATLTLIDADGHELAASDDYERADPMLDYRFTKDGEYLIDLHDARLQGRADWVYRLTVARRPLVTGAFPLAVTRGSSMEIQPAGLNLGSVRAVRLDVPAASDLGPKEIRFETGAGSSSLAAIEVSDLPEVVEAEGNDTPEHAGSIVLPGGVSGRIGAPFDVDYFRFHADRGKSLLVRVEAASIGSPLQAQLAVLDTGGRILASSSEELGQDAAISWSPPETGDYLLQVTDVTSRGSEAYRYHLTGRAIGPDFGLSVDEARTNVGAGGAAAVYVRAERLGGFAGEICLAVEGLPPGVTAAPGRIPAGGHDGIMILTAPSDAHPDLAAIRVTGTADLAGAAVTREARPLQATFTAGGARKLFPVESALVCVTGAPDVVITPALKELALAPGKRVRLDVEVTRKNGYAGPVSLDVVFRHLSSVCADPLPPGITVVGNQSKTKLEARETKGWITLEATPTVAPVQPLPIAVLGQVPVNVLLKLTYASEPVTLSVSEK
jgi:hypothetical protein